MSIDDELECINNSNKTRQSAIKNVTEARGYALVYINNSHDFGYTHDYDGVVDKIALITALRLLASNLEKEMLCESIDDEPETPVDGT